MIRLSTPLGHAMMALIRQVHLLTQSGAAAISPVDLQ
jgi:hypothetical protein